MKTLKSLLIALTVLITGTVSYTQTAAVLNIDTKGLNIEAATIANIVRIELEKTDAYTIMDKYDVDDILKKNNFQEGDCFGKTCLVKAGTILKADKMVTGNVERLGDKIIFNLRLIDVASSTIEKSNVMEYHNHQAELQRMAGVSVNNLMGISNNAVTVQLLTKPDGPIRVPHTRLSLNGPRMGVSYVTGELGRRLSASVEEGGYDTYPVMTQFGYQFETQYISNGNFQALIEIVPNVSGLDQGLFIPSLSFLNGFRDNKSGLEIAFGPTFNIRRKARGYYAKDGNGQKKWHLITEWDHSQGSVSDFGIKTEDNFDKRGIPILSTGWLWAVGKTFKSGYLNIPVNAFVAPGKSGWVTGISVGFNMDAE